MIIIFWLMLILLTLGTLAAAGILADPELAGSQCKSTARWLLDQADRWPLLSRCLDRCERWAVTFALLLFLLVDGEAATR